MPEQPEIRWMSTLINEKAAPDNMYVEVGLGWDVPAKKRKAIEPTMDLLNQCLKQGPIKVTAMNNGKELKLIMRNQQEIVWTELNFSMGMTGNWLYGDVDPNEKHVKLWFKDATGRYLYMRDPRKFATWRDVREGEWGPGRGPDCTKHISLFNHLINRMDDKAMQWPLRIILMDQRYFNGVGNYLRAEIIERSENSPEVSIELLHQMHELEKFCKLIAEVCHESYQLGAGQLKDFKSASGKSPEEFKSWLRVYGKGKSIIDETGRRFWYNPKWEMESHINL